MLATNEEEKRARKAATKMAAQEVEGQHAGNAATECATKEEDELTMKAASETVAKEKAPMEPTILIMSSFMEGLSSLSKLLLNDAGFLHGFPCCTLDAVVRHM